MAHRWERIRHPGFGAAFIAAAAGWSVFSWVIPSAPIVALSVVGEMVIVLTWKAAPIEAHWHHDWTMAAMVGGTAGGLLAAVIAWAGGTGPIGTMPWMTASMTGMIGGTLSGWRFYA